MPAVDIVIPFHSRPEQLRRCVASVRRAKVRTPYDIVVVNDGASGPEVARCLTELAESARVAVLEQPVRQGFAAAANRGFDLHRDRDVVVLHADAEVGNDWLDRLAAHAVAQDVGVVGAFTNSVGAAT